MVKRRRQTKFILDLFPIYCTSPSSRHPERATFYPVLRFDCNMKQLVGEFKWINP